LDNILRLLSANGINVEYMYAFVQATNKSALLILRFDKTDKALEVLTEHKIPIIPGETLYRM